MNRPITITSALMAAFIQMACSAGSGTDSSIAAARSTDTSRLVLDVRCASDAECPGGFECEVETEHGVTTSFCKSHGTLGAGDGGASPACPAGFEREVEHGVTYCKPHGGGGSDDDDGGSRRGRGGHDDDDRRGDNSGPGPGGAASLGSACSTDSDCTAGFECEVEEEHGVTTSYCKAHGRRGRSGNSG